MPYNPTNPTAKTSLGLLPQTDLRSAVVPLVIADQLDPSYCRIVPLVPTAKTSLPLLPQTERSSWVVPLDIGDQSATAEATGKLEASA